jgi:hypothetical protein
VLALKKQEKDNKQQQIQMEERKAGYGDKKLEGPDRPST